MESLVLTGIGAAALGYVAYAVWRSVSGKTECNCGSSGSCPSSGCCNTRQGRSPK